MNFCPVSWWPFNKLVKQAPSITFMSFIPHLEDMYPIYSASEATFPWISESYAEGQPRLKDYSSTRQNGITAKCSGIVGLSQRGWIVSSWCDIVIETTGDGETFKSRSALPPESFSHLPKGANGAPLGFFPPSVYGSLPSTGLPANTLKTLIKFHLPWTFRITPGWGLLTLPLEYTPEHRFSAAIGVINPRISQQLNPVLYWHVMKGQTLIKAGTPLMRIVPIPLTNKWNTIIRPATQDERNFYDSQRLFASAHYHRPHGLLGRFFDKAIGKITKDGTTL